MIDKSSYEVVMTWGKYKGYTLGKIWEINQSYLKWMTEAAGIPDVWKKAAFRTLEGESLNGLSLPTVKTTNISKLISDEDRKLKSKVNIDIVKNKAVISFDFDYKILEILKQNTESRVWKAKKKHWEVSIPELEKLIKAFGIDNVDVTDAVYEAIKEEKSRRKDLDIIRVKEDTHFEVKTEIELFPYQKVGVEFIVRAGGRAMIADEMGLGKTAQGIATALYYKSKTLVICPNSVKLNWVREIKKVCGQQTILWDAKNKYVADWSKTKGIVLEKFDGRKHKHLQFAVINYDIILKLHTELREEKYEMLILDECTYVKNHKTKRSKAIFGDGRATRKHPGLKAKYIILLTGTPVLNRPSEVYTLLHYLSPERFSNYFAFCQRYGGWKGEPSKNLKELHERTKDLVIRRRNSDVKVERPQKTVTELYIELSSEDSKEYKSLLKQLFRKWDEDRKPTIGTMPKIQQFLISKKLERVYEIIDEMIESNKSVVIFSTYKKPLQEIFDKYENVAGQINGDMNITDRQKTIDGISNGTLKVACITIGAGKMGIDGLQHGCDTAIFLDVDWTPSNMAQAEARLDRTGQINPVNIYYLLCNETIDIYMKELLDEKQKIIDTIVDGSPTSMLKEQGIFKDFVKMLKSNYNKELVNLSDIE